MPGVPGIGENKLEFILTAATQGAHLAKEEELVNLTEDTGHGLGSPAASARRSPLGLL